MKKICFSVGPSELYPGVEGYIKNALSEEVSSISHRGEEFSNLFKSVTKNLKKLLGIPKDYEIFFLSSGTEAMERVIQNLVEKTSLHFINGAFSKRFYQTAKELGKEPLKIEEIPGRNFDFKKIDIPKEVEVICFTQNETSTGTVLTMEDVYQLKKRHPQKLIAVDVVSSAPFVSINYKFTDCVFFSVQKGFGLPAGLGVLVVSPAGLKKAKTLDEKGISLGSYHSFLVLKKFADKHQTPETPNIFLLYLLDKVVSDMLKKGIEKIRKETKVKAKLLYNFFGECSFVKNPKDRSKTIVVMESEKAKELQERLNKKGFVVSGGYGEFKDKHLRIGNFPAHSTSDVKKLIKAFS